MDAIANMLSAIKNALAVKKEQVDLPHSRIKEDICRLLLAEGYISKCDIMSRMNKKIIRLTLKYLDNKTSVIEGMKRISSSSRRIYVGRTNIPRIRSGYGTVILTTPQGIMTDEQARAKKTGGEIICSVW